MRGHRVAKHLNSNMLGTVSSEREIKFSVSGEYFSSLFLSIIMFLFLFFVKGVWHMLFCVVFKAKNNTMLYSHIKHGIIS